MIFHFQFQMTSKIFVSNYKIMYEIDEKGKTLNCLIQQNLGDYDICKRIFELASNTFVVPVAGERQFDVEINPEEHERLLANVTTNFATKCLRSKRVTKIDEKYCNDADHQRLPNCYNCKTDADCTCLDRHWQHCILYNCDVW